MSRYRLKPAVRTRYEYIWPGSAYPVLGDRTYGGRPKPPAACPPELTAALGAFDRQALHACKLSLLHPLNNEKVTQDIELPPDMQNLLELLRRNPQTHGVAHAGA